MKQPNKIQLIAAGVASERQVMAIKLSEESDRYREIAKEISLDLLQRPFAPDVEKKKFTAQMHLIRAETFKTAATLITA